MIRIKKPRCNRVKKFRNYKRLVEIAKLYSFDFRLDEECSLINQIDNLSSDNPSYSSLISQLNNIKSTRLQAIYYFLRFIVRGNIKLVRENVEYEVEYHNGMPQSYNKIKYYSIIGSSSGKRIRLSFIPEDDSIVDVASDEIESNEYSFSITKEINRYYV